MKGLNDDEKSAIIPAIPDKYFHSFKLNHLKEYTNAKNGSPSTSTPKASNNNPTGSNNNPPPSASPITFNLNCANRCCHQPSNTNTPAPPSASHQTPQRNNKDVSNPPSNPSTSTPNASLSRNNTTRANNSTTTSNRNRSTIAKVTSPSSTFLPRQHFTFISKKEIDRRDGILLQRLQILKIAIKVIDGDGVCFCAFFYCLLPFDIVCLNLVLTWIQCPHCTFKALG